MAAQFHTRADGLDVESSESPANPEDYVVMNGFRLVKPYHFDFACNVRQRWFGQNIIEIFCREFPALGRQYYLKALAEGRLRVEGCVVAADTPLRDGQRMRHLIHRHEPPVPAGSIPVVGQSADIVAVCKPAGMPVHTAGQYRKNTVLGILSAERPDLGPLHPVHRLDKPVSGLLLFARTPASAAALCRTIESRGVEKLYVARVLGRFPDTPDGPLVADVPLAWDPAINHVTAEPGAAAAAVEAEAADTVAADAHAELAAQPQGQQHAELQQLADQQQQQQPAELSMAEQRRLRKKQEKLERQQRKAAKVARVAAFTAATAAAATKPSKCAAKPALTEFRLLAVAADGQTSIVECRPRTGRTHQIRVHLQHLGHPIANDTQYGGTYGGPMASRQMAQQLGVLWRTQGCGMGSSGDAAADEGNKRQRLDAAAAEVQQQAAEGAADSAVASSAAAAAAAPGGASAADEAAYVQSRAFRSQPEYEAPAELQDGLCLHCPYFAPSDYPFDLRPLWLHARSYSCQDGAWSYTADLPEWADAEWQPPS